MTKAKAQLHLCSSNRLKRATFLRENRQVNVLITVIKYPIQKKKKRKKISLRQGKQKKNDPKMTLTCAFVAATNSERQRARIPHPPRVLLCPNKSSESDYFRDSAMSREQVPNSSKEDV